MKQFFKYVFATIVGVVLSTFVLFFIFIGIMTTMVGSLGAEKETEVKDNSILTIRLPYSIEERTNPNPFSGGIYPTFRTKKIGLDDILARIKKAKEDDKIKGIYLETGIVQSSYATLEEIRNALLDFKTSNKFIFSYNEVYNQSAYYLSSVADSIFINPEGLLEFKGFASQTTFFKGTMEKLGIEAQIIKVGTFKSAVEPYTLEKMSEPNRRQVSSYLNSVYSHFISKISESRNIPTDSLYLIANQLRIQTPQDAVDNRFADALYHKDQVLASLKNTLNVEKGKDINSISIENYSNKEASNKSTSKDRIAVVYATGEIVSGEGSDEQIGSEKFSRTLRKLREDEKVKAVVLRINSPGGSALASDVIWREVELIQQNKPVIVSMGSVAASGGYYIACAADSIFAQPNTLTGSIGVFGIIPNMENFFNEKLGVTFDVVKTAEYSDLGTVTRPLSPQEMNVIQLQVNRIYRTFTEKVSKGRAKDIAYIDSIGQGRVWTGHQALEIGLVDSIGGIDRAIQAAANMADLADYKLVSYPSFSDPFESFFGNFSSKMQTWYTKKELGQFYPQYNHAKQTLERSGIQARLPFSLTIN